MAAPVGWSRVEEWVSGRVAVSSGVAAVGDGVSWLSYGELEVASSRFARHLVARGVGRGDRVGVAVERSAAMVAVLLGVWKAGGTYVPLDPGFPAERLRFMVADSGVSHVVVDGVGVSEWLGGVGWAGGG